jgi:HrpA-like RNA helicase
VFSKVTHLIVDEVHERHVDSDFLLAALKRILIERPDMKLIMMSATIDTNKFSKYFAQFSALPSNQSNHNKKQQTGGGGGDTGCPIITIPGFTHPVASYYLEDVSELTGLVPRNLAILRSKAKSSTATSSTTSSTSKTAAVGGTSNSTTTESKKKVASEVREDWETMNVDEVDEIGGDDDEEVDDDEDEEDEDVDGNSESGDGKLMPGQVNRFGEVTKSLKKGSEIGGSIDAAVTCDCKLIQSLIYKVISRGMHKSGSFLVFLPGVGEISKLCDVLNGKGGRRNNRYNGSGGGDDNDDENNNNGIKFDPSVKLLVLPLHGALSPRDQLEVFKTPRHAIKVVVATNIAETSITIPDCTVVIDSTRVKQTGFDAVRGSSYLALDWAAKDALNQRKGRAGRVAPGICFRLVPKR